MILTKLGFTQKMFISHRIHAHKPVQTSSISYTVYRRVKEIPCQLVSFVQKPSALAGDNLKTRIDRRYWASLVAYLNLDVESSSLARPWISYVGRDGTHKIEVSDIIIFYVFYPTIYA